MHTNVLIHKPTNFFLSRHVIFHESHFPFSSLDLAAHRVNHNPTKSWSHSSLSLTNSPIVHIPIRHASNMSTTQMQDTTLNIIAYSWSDVEPSKSPSFEPPQSTSLAKSSTHTYPYHDH